MVIRGIYDPPSTKALLGEIAIVAADVRQVRSRSPRTPDAPRRRYGGRSRDQVDGERLRRRDVPHGRRVSEGRHEGHGDDARDALRAARLLGHRLACSGWSTRWCSRSSSAPVRSGCCATIGMTRRQARRMIRHESVITALIGAALGLGARRVPLGARHAGADGLRTSRLSIPVAAAGRVHAGRGRRRHRRGDHARPPRLAAQRPRRPAVRVARSQRNDHDHHGPSRISRGGPLPRPRGARLRRRRRRRASSTLSTTRSSTAARASASASTRSPGPSR